MSKFTMPTPKRAVGVILGVASAAAPAFASSPSGTEGQSDNVPVTANVALSCGFSAAPSAIDFGGSSGVTPGEPSTATTSYTTECNDSNGYSIWVTDAGSGSGGVPTISGDNGSLTDAIYTNVSDVNSSNSLTAAALNPFVNCNPVNVVNGAYSSTGTTYTDTWTLRLPTSVIYPGTLTDVFQYAIFGQ
jgi:hypothetical protein